MDSSEARRSNLYHAAILRISVCGMCAAMFTGCGAFSNHKMVQQLQGENEQLISEYRAQKNQNEQLAKKNQLLESRVAESEKLLARQLGGTRLSSLPSQPAATAPGSAAFDPPARSPEASAASELSWRSR